MINVLHKLASGIAIAANAAGTFVVIALIAVVNYDIVARGLFNTSDHRILMPAVILMGSILALGADLFVHLPWERHFLHLNSVNALINVSGTYLPPN